MLSCLPNQEIRGLTKLHEDHGIHNAVICTVHTRAGAGAMGPEEGQVGDQDIYLIAKQLQFQADKSGVYGGCKSIAIAGGAI